MSQEPDWFLCAEGAVFPSKWVILHRIKLSGLVNTEAKTIRAKTDKTGIVWTSQFILLQNLQGNLFCKGYMSATKSTRINWFPINPSSHGKLSLFSYSLDHIWLWGVKAEAKSITSSLTTICLLTSFPSQGFYLPYSKYSWSSTAATEKIAQLT